MTRVEVQPAPHSTAEEDVTHPQPPPPKEDAHSRTHGGDKRNDIHVRKDDNRARKDDGVAKKDDGVAKKDDGVAKKNDGVAKKEKAVAKRDDAHAKTDDADALKPPQTLPTKDGADRDEEALDQILSTMGCRSCSPRHSFPCRVIFFLVLSGLDVADLVSDWLLYADVSVTKQGLVYGPPEDSVTRALLAFSIIGTFTFIFEGLNLWREIFRDNSWLDVDLVSALVIWFEDLPQIAINVYIAMCREDPISVFQLSKASVVLAGLLIRIIISLVKYCNKKALDELHDHTPESKRHVAFRVLIMVGLLINSACAVTVFIFTQTQRNMDGDIKFQVPKTIFEDQYNDQRYFQNVSVFIHFPDFDDTPPDSATNFRANWLRFMTINDIRDRSDLDISYNFVYEKTSTDLRMALFVKHDKTGNGQSGAWSLLECYQMALASRQIGNVSSATCQTSLFTGQAKSIFFTFSFITPDRIFRELIFGDICFNARIYENQACKNYDNFAESISDSTTIPAIHYYRTNATLAPSDMRHMLMEGGAPRFYRNDRVDLQDITEVWKTGWGRCESSGSNAPHFSDSIPIACSNMLSSVTG